MLREMFSNELFTVLIIIGLVCIGIAKATNGKRFHDFTQVVWNSKYLKIYSKDQKFVDGFDALLFTNLVISLSIFLFLCVKSFYAVTDYSNMLVIKVLVGTASFFLIKILLERLIGSLFEIDNFVDNFLFQKISYTNFLGLVLIPINALMLYTLESHKIAIYIAFFLLLLVLCIGLITSFKMHQNIIKKNLFYFILYLCALEITPYIILYKFLIE
ncbi:DUF4271 domain-containing protein [Corallibacter sp.]|uniref:DUF4271 domain-containing protein n=1 Tax=Corallibacter sp. TaxID=2038084 RepID=UPI003AB13D84